MLEVVKEKVAPTPILFLPSPIQTPPIPDPHTLFSTWSSGAVTVWEYLPILQCLGGFERRGGFKMGSLEILGSLALPQPQPKAGVRKPLLL